MAFEDPPGVVGDGFPSGGAYPANGLTFRRGGTNGAGFGVAQTCTLRASQRAVFTAVMNDFLARNP